MTGQVYTVAGGKGGVGKTTTVVNVATALQEAGRDVAVVDADLGMANLGAMLGIEYEPTIHRVLAGEAAVSDALTDGPGGITVLPGARDLEAFADADPAKLRKVIDALASAYEVVLVDTGAGLSHEVAVPLGLADGVVLVTTPDDAAVRDALKTARLAEQVDGEVSGVVLSRAGDGTDGVAAADELGTELLAVVPEDEAIPGDEQPVVSRSDSQAAEAYRRLAAALEGTDATTGGTGTDEDDAEEPAGTAADEGDGTDREDENENRGGDGGDQEDDEDGGGVFDLFG